MKVLLIDVNCKNSSTGQIVYNLFSYCNKNGIDAAVAYGRGAKINEPGIFKFGIDLETNFHALMTRLTGLMGYFSYFSTVKLIRFIKKYKPDVVHIHELHSYFINPISLLKFLKKNNIKTVITNHCEFLYTGKCGHAKTCLKFTEKCGGCPLKKEYPTSLFFDFTRFMLNDKKKIFNNWNNSLMLVSPSEWLKKRMLLSFLKDKEIITLNNGVDTNLFVRPNHEEAKLLRKKLKINEDNKIVVTAAYDLFSNLKGGSLFLEIAKKFRGEKVTFLAIGAKEPINFEEKNINVQILPLITDKKTLFSIFSIADCFVICSSHENFPTTSLEAQCLGSKVCAFDVGGVSETILPNNGFVSPYGDIEQIVNNIRIVLNENYDKDIVSNKSIDRFSNRNMLEKYIEVYKKI